MTLQRRLTLAALMLTGSLLAIGGLCLWGFYQVNLSLDAASAEFAELRMVEQVGVQIAHVRGSLESERPSLAVISLALDEAVAKLEQFVDLQERARVADPEHQRRESELAVQFVRRLNGLAIDLGRLRGDYLTSADRAEAVATVDALLSDLQLLAQQIEQGVINSRQQAGRRLRGLAFTVASIAVVVVVAGLFVITGQYRSVMRPLRRLKRGVERVAAGELTHQLPEEGDAEFVALARDFNRMSSELQSLYDDLDRRVQERTRELARAERLASVGFLAAGVAHEINNPMGIISGYAELSLKELEDTPPDETRQHLTEALEIIRDEAFRCKKITQKLLSLMQRDDAPREPVEIAQVAREVVALVGGLKQYRHLAVKLEFPEQEPLRVVGRQPELKQVLLNLTINALEAVRENNGHVIIAGQRDNGRVTLTIADTGKGMTSEVLDHVFEPFFTQRRSNRDGETGTGLGLFIVHAIVSDMGGTIAAASAGPGQGSRFIISWPGLEANPNASAPARGVPTT